MGEAAQNALTSIDLVTLIMEITKEMFKTHRLIWFETVNNALIFCK